MLNFTTALYGEFSGSALAARIGSRLYKGRAPEGATFPYAVYTIISDVPERTFTEDFENVLVQFSLFSTESGTTEIEDMYSDLIALYDEPEFIIDGELLLWMQESNSMFNAESYTTLNGAQNVWVYHVDFDVKLQIGYSVIWTDTTGVEFTDTTGVEYEDWA